MRRVKCDQCGKQLNRFGMPVPQIIGIDEVTIKKILFLDLEPYMGY